MTIGEANGAPRPPMRGNQAGRVELQVFRGAAVWIGGRAVAETARLPAHVPRRICRQKLFQVNWLMVGGPAISAFLSRLRS
jgi:hypothetical protein